MHDSSLQVAPERWPKAGGRTGRMAVFVAEIEVESGPLMVVRALICRHLSPIQSPLEGGPYFCGNLLHGNVCGWYRPSWAESGDCGAALGRLAS